MNTFRCYLLSVVWVVLAMLCLGTAGAQQIERKALDTWARESWNQQSGLRSDQVNALAQTADGYLWVGTPDGLARFNGSEFSFDDRSTVDALHDNDIRQLAIGREGSLLVSTARGGVSFLNQGWWSRRGADSGLAQETVTAAQEDARGRLWVTTASGGLDVFDGRRQLHFGSRNGLPSDRVLSLLIADDGSVWVGTSAGLARIVDDRVQTISVNAGALPSGAITALSQAQDRSLWVGTRVGAYRQRRGDQAFEKMTPDAFDDVVQAILPDSEARALVGTAQHGLLVVRDGRSEAVREHAPGRVWSVDALLRGSDGSIWVGSNQGLLRLRDTPFSGIGKTAGLTNENVHAIVQAADGDIWIGTDAGLDRMHDGRIESVALGASTGKAVFALAAGSDGRVWIGTDSAGVLQLANGRVVRGFDQGHGLPSDSVRALLADRGGRLWIGTSKGLVLEDGDRRRVFTTADGLPSDSIFSVFRDAGGRIWVGTSSGMTWWNGEQFARVPLPARSMVQAVYGFANAGGAAVWIASDRGLLRWKDGSVAALGSEHGLPVDTVYSVVPDREGNLWLTTFSGLVRVSREQAEAVADGRARTLTADVYGVTDGLPTSQCNGGSSPAATLLSDGSVWVATARGIGQIHPERVADYRSEPPQALIEEVRVDDRVVVPSGTLALEPGTRKLDVRFYALNYHLPRRIKYRYWLEGYDRDWSDIGEHTSVQFTNLSAGDYRLRIQAAVTGGSWSPREATLAFHVGAHLWQKLWFDVLLAVLIVAAGWLAYRARIRVIAVNERRLQQLVDARTEDLRRQTELLRAADAEKSELLEMIRAQSEAFERQAREDALTGIANRRRIDDAIEVYFAEARRSGRPLSFVLMDIDHFKRVNDRWSHATGDAVLQQIGGILRGHQRPGDLAGRLGGEEFACILSGSDLGGARTYCERMRMAIETHDWAEVAPGLAVTVSMGVVQWDGVETWSRMSSRADELLYRAKNAGRNRVEG